MILSINTTNGHDIEVVLKDEGGEMLRKKVSAKYSQAEKLLPLIDKILIEKKQDLKDVREIHVNNTGGSFTALRIGVVTANALGYSLGVPVQPNAECRMQNVELKKGKFDVVKPIYSKAPNITKSKK